MPVRPLPWKSAGGDDHHREVDHARERERDHDVDLLEAEDLLLLLVVAADDPPLGQRRVQVDDVRHHRRADDPGGEQDALGAGEAGDEEVLGDFAAVGVGVEELEDEGGDDDADQGGDPRLQPAEAHLLQGEDREGAGAGDQPGREERDAEEQVEAERGADHLGDVAVAIATSSAWSQRPIEVRREKRSRQSSARFLPVAMPSFADWVWTTIAIRLAARTTQSSR